MDQGAGIGHQDVGRGQSAGRVERRGDQTVHVATAGGVGPGVGGQRGGCCREHGRRAIPAGRLVAATRQRRGAAAGNAAGGLDRQGQVADRGGVAADAQEQQSRHGHVDVDAGPGRHARGAGGAVAIGAFGLKGRAGEQQGGGGSGKSLEGVCHVELHGKKGRKNKGISTGTSGEARGAGAVPSGRGSSKSVHGGSPDAITRWT